MAVALLAVFQVGFAGDLTLAQARPSQETVNDVPVTVYGCLTSDQFQPVIDEFGSRTAFTATYQPICDQGLLARCPTEGGCPDVALMPWPGLLAELGDAGDLVDLGTFISSTVLASNYSGTWIDLGTHDGTLYAVWFNANNKSLVWYDPVELASKGWTTPTNWTETIALSDQMVAAGQVPWSIGNESGGATGWVLSDWFEDILLRSVGPDVYDDLITHSIPWTSTHVISTANLFGEIFGNEDYQLGGRSGTLGTSFMDAIYPPFEDPPEAYLHRQGTFAQFFISGRFPSQIAGTDYSVFPFPDIDPAYKDAVTGAGDGAILFTDTAATRALIDFLITVDAAEIWIGEGGMTPNRGVNFALYTNPNTRKSAEWLADASIFRFDLTDQLPFALNQYVLSQMDELVWAAPDSAAMARVLGRIEFMATHPNGAFMSLPLVVREYGP
jgi:alpha-glucoside transport system substrate-binding protein